MVDAADPALDEAPESFNRVRVNIPNNVNLLAMFDPTPLCQDE
jgi:hypothetical protein